jgi:BolA protein
VSAERLDDALGTEALLRARLASLDPVQLELYDESHEHAGHAGARDGGGHFQLTIVSARFAGHDRLARHRMVYRAVGDLMPGRVHALSITASTPEEMNAAFQR